MPFKLLDRDGDNIGLSSNTGGRRLGLQKVAIVTVGRIGDLIVGGWSPVVRQRLPKTIDKAFGECIEGQRSNR